MTLRPLSISIRSILWLCKDSTGRPKIRSRINHGIRSQAWQAMLVLLVGGLVYLGVIFVAVRAESHLLMTAAGYLVFSFVLTTVFLLFTRSGGLPRNLLSGLLCAGVMLLVAEMLWTIPLLSIEAVQRRAASQRDAIDHVSLDDTRR